MRRSCAILAGALRHPRTPWYAKAIGVVTLLYALSPIDLVPDFIPIVGHVDDLILIPLGIWLTVRLIPRAVWAECEAEILRSGDLRLAKDWRGVLVVVVLWTALLLLGLAMLQAFL